MTHPDEGSLRALLDDETSAEETQAIRTHVAGCDVCSDALERAASAAVRTTSLLAALDVPAPVVRVRAALAARGSASRAARRPWLGRGDLAKAAVLLVGFAGMVAAAVHPASPLRRWLAGNAPSTDAVTTTAAPAATAPSAAAPEVGVRVALVPAGVTIALDDAPVGTAIEVTWTDTGAAAVYAGEGTTFSTSASEGRIDAAAVAGPVRVELPRGAARASLVVHGRVYLEKAGERVDYPGPPALVEGTRVRFEVR